jgi:flavin-dependent dehydrogenase
VTTTAADANPCSLDVAIVGGGLAGSLLARQLRRQAPELSVGLFEQERETSFKVGEATVEIASNYLVRRLGLSTYLYERQLPKNGLRYFFDTPECDRPLEEMSEVGSVSLPFHPAFQLDRASLEADLQAMNRRDGVHLRSGARVEALELGSGGARHRFAVTDDSGTRTYDARWLIDAAGRRGFLARRLGLRVDEDGHRIGSVWGRFEDVVDIDSFGPEAFRSRIRHTPRRLSTIHFWYRGYWVWFIPLRGGLTSVGVTGERVSRDRELRTRDGFQRFLATHHAIATLLRGAKLVDLGSLARIAYSTRRYFAADDRWGLSGEAATAADPLYSPGSDFIALENDFLVDLVVRDATGESADALAERAGLYDDYLQFRQRATMLLYEGLYDTLGSFELACAKWDFDIGLYYNLWVTAYLRDQHLDLEFLRAQLRLEPFVLRAMRNFAALFQRVAQTLEARGDYYRANTGRFYHGLTNIDFAERVGCDRSEAEVMTTTLDLFNCVRAQAAVLLGTADSVTAVAPQPMSAFLGRRPVV